MKKILIIDDEVNVALLLSKFLTRNGFDVTTASTGTIGMEYLKNGDFNLVLCDFRLEDTDGRAMLKNIKTQYPKTGVIIITGYSDIKMAVELIKMGAYDYITKPLYPDEILNTITKAIETHYALVEDRAETTNNSTGNEKSSRENRKQAFNGEFEASGCDGRTRSTTAKLRRSRRELRDGWHAYVNPFRIGFRPQAATQAHAHAPDSHS